jgi:hemoglobin/transferrin/lactoferrin receptor protein
LFSEYNGWKKINRFSSGSVDNPSEATIDGNPSWATLNIRLGFELHSLAHLQFGVYNFTDAHYKTFASGISAPGRAFIISLRSFF